MIRIVSIDDEPLALKLLDAFAKRIPDLELVAACFDTASARKILESEQVDCIFLDINMPDESGMDFVRSLPKPPAVVFTTAYPQYAVEGFRVNAVDYLLKPFGFDDFSEAVGKVRKHMQLTASGTGYQDRDKVFFFRSGYRKIRVPVSEILYVESMGAYLKVHISGGDPIVTLGSLKSIPDAAPESLVRVHKTYVVNIDRMSQSSRSSVTLDDGTVIPIGDAYKESFSARLGWERPEGGLAR